MGSARIAGLDSSSEEILDIVEDQGCVVDCVDLDSEELFAHGPGQALAEVVEIKLNVQRNGCDCCVCCMLRFRR